MRFRVLGSGTSTGVPVLGCGCHVCTSEDPRDKRLRACMSVESGDTVIVVDTGPDFRTQMLRAGYRHIDAILYTHSHYDHIGGIDDLRPYSHFQNGMPVYLDHQTFVYIEKHYPYLVHDARNNNVAHLDFNFLGEEDQPYAPFRIGDVDIQPVRLMHVPVIGMRSVGYVFNGKVGYITDLRFVFAGDRHFLENLDTLIVGTPLPTPHANHLAHEEAVDLIHSLKVTHGYLSHLGHDLLHTEHESRWGSVRPAWDGLVLSF